GAADAGQRAGAGAGVTGGGGPAVLLAADGAGDRGLVGEADRAAGVDVLAERQVCLGLVGAVDADNLACRVAEDAAAGRGQGDLLLVAARPGYGLGAGDVGQRAGAGAGVTGGGGPAILLGRRARDRRGVSEGDVGAGVDELRERQHT